MERDHDSRDWKPPDDMKAIFRLVNHARMDLGIDGNGKRAALENLVEAVELLARHVADKEADGEQT
jgi:hypothetical protein